MRKKLLFTLLATGILLSPTPFQHTTYASTTIQENKEEQSQVKSTLQSLQEKQSKINKEIEVLDKEYSELDVKLLEKEESIARHNTSLENLKKEQERLEKYLSEHLPGFEDKVAKMEKQSKKQMMLSVIFGSDKFGDIFDRAKALSHIAKYEDKFFTDYFNARDELKENEKNILATKKALEFDQQMLLEMQKQLDLQMSEKSKLFSQVKQEEENLEQKLTELTKQYESWIKPFIKPSSGKITSLYGRRWGEKHQGIDIAQSGRVKIVAASNGVVSDSYYSTSYGNVVFIKHNIGGQVFETVYAHMRNRAVRVGQKVTQGQYIGYMGNTGESYGQHLHFEVHKGTWNHYKSNSQDPMKYMK